MSDSVAERVWCLFCGEDVNTREAREVYVPHAVTSIGTTVQKLAWAHPRCGFDEGSGGVW